MKGLKTKEAHLVEGMPNKDYHEEKNHVSASSLKRLKKSPLHFITKPGETESRAFNIGIAFEELLLEGKAIEDKFFIFDKSLVPFPDSSMAKKENKEYKAALMADNEGKKELSKDDFDSIQEMVKRTLDNETVFDLLSDCQVQPSVFYDFNGVGLKSRPDFWNVGAGWICDVKTIDDASPENVERQIAKFDYHIQMIMQIIALQKLGGEFKYYFYLFVEKKAPHDAVLYKVNAETITFAEMELTQLLETLKDCRRENKFEGLASKAHNKRGILTTGLPAWKMNS